MIKLNPEASKSTNNLYSGTAKQVAAWLLRHTSVTPENIADFCEMNVAEVAAMMQGYAHGRITETNPLDLGILEKTDIAKSHADNSPLPKHHWYNVQGEYFDSRDKDYKNSAISWMLINYPKIAVSRVAKLTRTSPETIKAIKNSQELATKSASPVALGLCTSEEFQEAISTKRKKS